MPDHYYNHSRRNQRSLAEPYNTSPYPGISPYVQVPPPGAGGLYSSYGAGEVAETALAVPVEASAAKAGGLLGSLGSLGGLGGLGNAANIEQIKGFIDRMGGIDGIVSSMGKVQKVMQSFQQMAPMVKLVMSSFGKNKGSKNGSLAAEEDAALYSPARRKKRRPNQRRKSTPTNRRRSSPANSKRRRK
ncbi:hypothetical protein [Paenibacillus wynnii]|uniref:Tyrosine protein kinase n=1 Tax=Paenibacillus wynnii TaxID=268407 RepID=A0A098MA33_9BACL|nr:hypothetical protein [Paenibacillus wynnii]KGE19410.1 hypothetical protein PWYN_08710 [Paenibacillus wynnii]